MKPGPKLVLSLLLDAIRLDEPPRPIDSWIEDIIRQNPAWGYDPTQKAQSWSLVIANFLQQNINDSIDQGKQPRIAFNSSSNYMVQGACFVEPTDTAEVKEQKQKRLFFQQYYDALRNLSPRDFEQLCAKVLNLIGVLTPQLTPYQNDQGIDFYGKLSIGDIIGHGAVFPIFETRLVIWLIGQAKHYKASQVATPDIRNLVGATDLAKARAFTKSNLFPDLVIRVCDPVIMLFFTTGQISMDGWTLCKNSGVAAMDGEMLASFLADKSIAVKPMKGKVVFDPKMFQAWLKS